jgi:transcriptional regulator with XRE-family HTH domain
MCYGFGMKYRFNLRAVREGKNITQAQLVRIMGEPQWRVSRWETGVVLPDADQIIRLAVALGVTPGMLFERLK